jgi:hypothetical protein
LITLLHSKDAYKELSVVHVADGKPVSRRILFNLFCLDALVSLSSTKAFFKN